MVVAVVTYPCPGPCHPDGTRVVVAGLRENLGVRVAVTIRHYRPVYIQALSFSVLSATSAGRRTLKGTTVRVYTNIGSDISAKYRNLSRNEKVLNAKFWTLKGNDSL